MFKNHEMVIFDGTLAGESVRITAGMMLANDALAEWVLHSALKRIEGSFATNAGKGASREEKETAILRAFQAIQNGERPARTGGGLSDEEIARRQVMAAWAKAYDVMSYSAAYKAAAEDSDALARQIAEAIIRKQDGKKPSKDELDKRTPNFIQRVQRDVAEKLQAAQSVEI